MFHHNNARPHTSLATPTKLLELDWEVMSPVIPHTAPDLAPSDYHLFWSLQNFLNRKNFSNNDDLKSHFPEFFAVKDQKFYQHHEVTRKMARGHWTEWKIFDWLKFFLYSKKNWSLFHARKPKLRSCQPIMKLVSMYGASLLAHETKSHINMFWEQISKTMPKIAVVHPKHDNDKWRQNLIHQGFKRNVYQATCNKFASFQSVY